MRVMGGSARCGSREGRSAGPGCRRARRHVLAPPLAALAGALVAVLSITASLPAVPSGATPRARQVPLLAGRISAIGDSVMIDYEQPLEQDLHGVVVDAQVSRQFSTGIQVVQQLRAEHQLGDRVIIGLGTNGTVTPLEFAQMTSALAGASRVVFVTVHVDQPWQNEVNGELSAGVAAHRRIDRLANWAALASGHPGWFYSDGTHLPIDGTGADALASLIAKTMTQPSPALKHAASTKHPGSSKHARSTKHPRSSKHASTGKHSGHTTQTTSTKR